MDSKSQCNFVINLPKRTKIPCSNIPNLLSAYLDGEHINYERNVSPHFSITSDHVKRIVTHLDNSPGCYFTSTYPYEGRYTLWGMATLGIGLRFLAKAHYMEIIVHLDSIQILKNLANYLINSPICIDSIKLKVCPNCCFLALECYKEDVLIESNRGQRKNILSVLTVINNFLKPNTIRQNFNENYELYSQRINESQPDRCIPLFPDGPEPKSGGSYQGTIIGDEKPIQANCVDLTLENDLLGFYGAFGFDLVYQFEDIEKTKSRGNSLDFSLSFPLKFGVINYDLNSAYEVCYSMTPNNNDNLFETEQAEKPELLIDSPFQNSTESKTEDSYFLDGVKKAIKEFESGNLFECVLSDMISCSVEEKPSYYFSKLCDTNPAPFGLLINLRDTCNTHLVGASPEIFVRIHKRDSEYVIETCPISGTIARGSNPVEDSRQILALLSDTKEEAELTMCTDVDRNDKNRVCKPGSVRILERRQIEKYSRLIHTVDHVEGILKEDIDPFQAFLSHMWAVAVTGAPKKAALEFIENTEPSSRQWYGGAVGWWKLSGEINTALTIRTAAISNQISRVRAGSTLLYHSIPEKEAKEVVLKGKALMDILRNNKDSSETCVDQVDTQMQLLMSLVGGKKAVICDHDDSFVHTLANYCRKLGIITDVIRSHKLPLSEETLNTYDLIILSAGPKMPKDFGLHTKLEYFIGYGKPVLGICLGFQAIVSYYGGLLLRSRIPAHGIGALITDGRKKRKFIGARYHSTFVSPECLPTGLIMDSFTKLDEATDISFAVKGKDETPVTDHPRAVSSIVMSIHGIDNWVSGLQYHPESLLTDERTGLISIGSYIAAMVNKDWSILSHFSS